MELLMVRFETIEGLGIVPSGSVTRREDMREDAAREGIYNYIGNASSGRLRAALITLIKLIEDLL